MEASSDEMEILTLTGSIRSQVIPCSGVSYFEVRGRLQCDVFIQAMVEHWTKTPTPHAVWDFEYAELSDLDADSCHELATVANDLAKSRGNHPRSVLITKNKAEYFLLRYFVELMEIGNSPISYEIVDTKDLAVQYLQDNERFAVGSMSGA